MTDNSWLEERTRVASSFDRVADLYRDKFGAELADKPFDRDFLQRVARRLGTSPGPVLEVGAGPGQIGAFLAGRGVSVIVSDASIGQMREARALGPGRPLVAADLARLPVRRWSLMGIVAFYCLIFGPPEQLDTVFADWREALAPGGLAVVAVHAGHGSKHTAEFGGRAIDVTVEYRDPDDLAFRMERNGFAVDELVVRPPEAVETTDRCYVVATRAG